MRETELYRPVKAYLERQGYDVKSEIRDCDVVAVRGDEDPVIVEMKLSLSLALLMQGIDRQTMTDAVYVAVPTGKGRRWLGQVKDAVKLCRRLGLGLLSVRMKTGAVQVHVDPGPYQPRKMKKRKEALLREFERRVGDPNTGGQTRRKVVTAYRQDALRIAGFLAANETAKPAQMARELDVPAAASILQKDHYGWFERVQRGVYRLGEQGHAALILYDDVVQSLSDCDRS